MSVQVAAFYGFTALDAAALPALQMELRQLAQAAQLRGTVLLAEEGVNGTVSGPEPGVQRLLARLRQLPGLERLEAKLSRAPQQAFHRLKVRLKREIVTLGVPGVDPTAAVGEYVKPRDWNALISTPGVVVIDTRNDYEVALGTFEGALDPQIRSFRALPGWVSAQPSLAPDAEGRRPPVAMFCTGGIRCEKATALLKARGFERVYHLEGGVLKYLEEVPASESLWRGECFVFDERGALGHGLAPREGA